MKDETRFKSCVATEWQKWDAKLALTCKRLGTVAVGTMTDCIPTDDKVAKGFQD